jgi:hypothetical protein
MAQYAGIGSLSIAALASISRRINEFIVLKKLLYPILISNGIGVIISILGTLNGIMNLLGWLLVFVYLFFTVGFLYYLLRGD